MTRIKVRLPKWFSERAYAQTSQGALPTVYGFTEGKTVYRIDSTASTENLVECRCYEVEVAELKYKGYIRQSDLVIVGKENGLSIRRK